MLWLAFRWIWGHFGVRVTGDPKSRYFLAELNVNNWFLVVYVLFSDFSTELQTFDLKLNNGAFFYEEFWKKYTDVVGFSNGLKFIFY